MADTSMQGKTCLVTGATNGIGLVTAEGLASRGATVVLSGRNAEKVRETIAGIQSRTGNAAVTGIVADLSSQAEVRRAAAEFQATHDRLDVLVNNAGMLFMRRQLSADGIEMTFALDHLGYFLLTNLLLDTLKVSTPARIVNVASAAHIPAKINFDDLQGAKGYVGLRAYGQAKLANIMFTYELARRLQGTGITANALHPGVVRTGFAKNNGPVVRLVMNTVYRWFQIDPQKGAETSLFLATSPDVEGVTGNYFDTCKAIKSNNASYDKAAQERLWEISAQMVGLKTTAGV